MKQWTIAMMVAVASTLAACGGGGGGAGTGATPAATQATTANITMAPACSGTNCGALGNTYAGSGVGLWQATNTGGAAAGTIPAYSTVSTIINSEAASCERRGRAGRFIKALA